MAHAVRHRNSQGTLQIITILDRMHACTGYGLR